MLLSASWVIGARWREIQRFVSEFKTIKRIHDIECWCFFIYFPKQKICAQTYGRRKLENVYCRNYFIKQSFCHTFPVIPRAQNYRECMGQKKQYLGITKNRYQVQFISAMNSDLLVWILKAKVYKVESCTVYFALNFHRNL